MQDNEISIEINGIDNSIKFSKKGSGPYLYLEGEESMKIIMETDSRQGKPSAQIEMDITPVEAKHFAERIIEQLEDWMEFFAEEEHLEQFDDLSISDIEPEQQEEDNEELDPNHDNTVIICTYSHGGESTCGRRYDDPRGHSSHLRQTHGLDNAKSEDYRKLVNEGDISVGGGE